MRHRYKPFLPTLVVCTILLIFFAVLYHFDNKYTMRAPVLQDGRIDADAALQSAAPLFLVEGWRIYDGISASEAPLQSGERSIFIGEISNFSLLTSDASPYGDATYTLDLQGNGTFALYLPEVFCAYRIYIDDTLLGGNGSLSPYQAQIRDSVYAFSIDGEAQLRIETANYTHYYSGIYYPPAIGTPDAISRLLFRKTAIYSLLCFSSVSIALFSLFVWLGVKGKRDLVSLLFGLLSLSFAGRICYPFLHLEGAGPVRLVYAAEDFCALAIIFFAVRIAEALCGYKVRKVPCSISFPVTACMCVVGVVFPLFILPSLPAFLGVYGKVISCYKLASAAYLVVISVCGIRGGVTYAPAVLSGVAAYGIGLLTGVLTMNRLEPALGAWPEEYGSFAMVLLFVGLLVLRNRQLLLENLRLTQHLREEVELQTQKLTELSKERRTLLSGMIHDLKSPLTLILNYARFIENNDILQDNEARAQAALIRQKCSDMTGRVKDLQEIAIEEEFRASTVSPIDLSVLLREFYEMNKDDVSVVGTEFSLHLPIGAVMVEADEEGLERILENLLYNALDFTPPDGEIALRLWREGGEAIVAVTDTGCGIAPEALGEIFDRFFTTRPRSDERRGLGLYTARQIAREHGGSLTVESTVGCGTVFHLHLPLSRDSLPFSGFTK